MKKLFLSHARPDATDVHQLAAELRFRGVAPWVDQLGGFGASDDSAIEAARAISEDTFGFLLYATEKALKSDFIRLHEVPPALARKKADSSYMLFAIPRDMSFETLGKKTLRAYGQDLSRYNTFSVEGDDADRIVQSLRSVSDEVLRKVVSTSSDLADGDEYRLQFSTWEAFPTEDDRLFIDGRIAYEHDADPALFDRLVEGMRSVKREIAARFARPTLRVEGSKHLSAAFAFGRVFQPFDLNVHQADGDYWRSGGSTKPNPCRLSEFRRNSADGYGGALAVEISTRFKELSEDVDTKLSALPSFSRLVLRPKNGPLDVDAAMCRDLVEQAYNAIELSVQAVRPRELHIFAAAPQSLMMMLGRRFAGMPRTFVYDYRDGAYGVPHEVPAGPL